MREKFRELVEEIKRDVSSYDSAKRTQQTNLLNQTAREAGIDVDLLDLESGDHAAYYNADRLLKFRGEALKVAHDISCLLYTSDAADE